MFKKLFLSLCLCATLSLSADMGNDGAAVTKENISWQPVKYVDPDRDMRAQLPGKTKKTESSLELSIESACGDALYKIDIYNSFIPKDPKIILAMVNAKPGVTGKIVKQGLPKNCSHLIAFEKADKGKIVAVGRVYVTKNAAYNFIVQGNLSLADKVFETVEIRQ